MALERAEAWLALRRPDTVCQTLRWLPPRP